MYITHKYYLDCADVRDHLSERQRLDSPSLAGRHAVKLYLDLDWPNLPELPPWQSIFTVAFGAQIIARAWDRDPVRSLPGGWQNVRFDQLNDRLWKLDISDEIETVLSCQLQCWDVWPDYSWKYVAEFATSIEGVFSPFSALSDFFEWDRQSATALVQSLVRLLPWPVSGKKARDFVRLFPSVAEAEAARQESLSKAFATVIGKSDNDVPLMYEGTLVRSKDGVPRIFNPNALWRTHLSFLWLGSEVSRAAELSRLEDYQPIALAESDPNGQENWTFKQHVNLADVYVPFRKSAGRPRGSTSYTPEHFVAAYRAVAAKGSGTRVTIAAVAACLGMDAKHVRDMIKRNDGWSWERVVEESGP